MPVPLHLSDHHPSWVQMCPTEALPSQVIPRPPSSTSTATGKDSTGFSATSTQINQPSDSTLTYVECVCLCVRARVCLRPFIMFEIHNEGQPLTFWEYIILGNPTCRLCKSRVVWSCACWLLSYFSEKGGRFSLCVLRTPGGVQRNDQTTAWLSCGADALSSRSSSC